MPETDFLEWENQPLQRRQDSYNCHQLSLGLFFGHAKMFLNFIWKNEQVKMFQEMLQKMFKKWSDTVMSKEFTE